MSAIDSLLDELRATQAHGAPPAWLDPRAVVLWTMAFLLVVVSFGRYSLAPLLPLVAVPVLMARAVGLPLRALARKVFWTLPLLLMVGVFNPLLDTKPGVIVGTWTLSAGWVSLLSLLLRGALCVAAMLVLLRWVGGFARLAAALRALGVPVALATQLLLMQRYALVVAEDLAHMERARALRGGGVRVGLRAYGSLLGHLLLRSIERAIRIHQAMLARGGVAALVPVLEGRWRWRDTLALTSGVLLLLLLRLGNGPQLLGRLVLQGVR